MNKGMSMIRYCCTYYGREVFIWAPNWWWAQDSAAEIFKPAKLSEIRVEQRPCT